MNKTKVCQGICGQRRSVKMFSKKASNADGLQKWCKVCNAYYGREWKSVRKSKMKKYNHKYYLKHRTATLEERAEYKDKHPGRIKARAKMRRAIISGEIERQPCEVCGTLKGVHPHHKDYRKWSDVSWRCCTHHLRKHAQIKFARRGININASLNALERKAA